MRAETAAPPGTTTSFDAQAAGFDRRAGLPEADCRAIAEAVLELGGVSPGDRVVEIGAGTGMIGRWLAGGPVPYAGLDLSRGMLAVFRRRAGCRSLAAADCSRPWPIASGSARVVFSSRAIHLLPQELAVAEARRVAVPGGTAILGWVERRPESVKARMAREMQRRLRELGFAVKSAGSRRFLAACSEQGAEVLDRRQVVSWPVEHTAGKSLADWRSKEGLGGIVLPPGVQDDVLRELEAWALASFGSLDAAFPSEEVYVLEGVRWTES